MGTMITLGLGNLEIDWGKNNVFTTHGHLFQDGDLSELTKLYSDETSSDESTIETMTEVYRKPLNQVKDRLSLLGYSRRTVEREYINLLELHGIEEGLEFDELEAALRLINVHLVDDHYGQDYEPGEFFRDEIRQRLFAQSQRLQRGYKGEEISMALENFSADARLWLLSQNPQNLSLEVHWDFGDLVNSGWVQRATFSPGVHRSDRFLIVTEGSSDANVIRKALSLYRPHVCDFFHFVDMGDGYPFSGIGGLVNFTKGLSSIDLQNNAVIVFDNDAEGVAAWNRTLELKLPQNIRTIRLPDLDSLKSFNTIGPSGVCLADINGKAAAIECYLDLTTTPQIPRIRWTSFKKDPGVYQGELEQKEVYAKAFFELRATSSSYDSTKIELVLDHLIACCAELAERNRFALLNSE